MIYMGELSDRNLLFDQIKVIIWNMQKQISMNLWAVCFLFFGNTVF